MVVLSELFSLTEDVDDRAQKEFNATQFLSKPTLLSVINAGDIRGLTIHGSELFVVRSASSQLSVYNTKNFTLTRNMTIENSIDMREMVASPGGNSLYISDPGLRGVHRYDLSNNVHTQWSVGGQGRGLFVKKNNNILVTVWDALVVKEYTPGGKLIREIPLDSSMKTPWHSIELSNGQFIVCHGNNGTASMHRVCIVDVNGRIIKCYGGAHGSRIGELQVPKHLAVDSQGNVLVADWANHRVVLLSPSLEHLGYIPIPGHQQLSYPWTLHLDELNRRLYIGEWSSSTEGVQRITECVFVLTA